MSSWEEELKRHRELEAGEFARLADRIVSLEDRINPPMENLWPEDVGSLRQYWAEMMEKALGLEIRGMPVSALNREGLLAVIGHYKRQLERHGIE